MTTRPKPRGYVADTANPADRIRMMTAIDQSIADRAVCTVCGWRAELVTEIVGDSYRAMLKCKNPNCGRTKYLS
jgi:hypothetical protein